MAKAKKSDEDSLAATLAQRVGQLRERRNMTRLDLSRATHIPIKRIEALESGEEIWLSFADRAALARALGVLPACLKEVEKIPPHLAFEQQAEAKKEKIDLYELAEDVLAGKTGLLCPDCKTPLKTSIENAWDIEERLCKIARAYCPLCPFTLR